MTDVTASPPFAGRDRVSLGLLLLAAPAAGVLGLSAAAYPMATAAAAVAALAGLAALLRPQWATLIFVFVVYANLPVVAVRFHGVPRPAAAAVLGLLLLPLLHQVLILRQPLVFPRGTIWISAFLCIQFFSGLRARSPETALDVTLTNVAEGLVLFLLVVNVVRSPAVLRQTAWALLAAASMMATLTVVQVTTRAYHRDFGGLAQVPKDVRDHESLVTRTPRPTGPIGEKNYYAQFLVMLLPLAVALGQSSRRPVGRVAAGTALLLITAGVALTESRGAAVGAAAMLAAMFWGRTISWRHLGLAAVAGAIVLAAVPGYRERLMGLADFARMARGTQDARASETSLQGRMSEMMAAAVIVAKHPAWGVGPGNFPLHFLDHADLLGFQVHREERLAHCAALEIAAETGFAGLACVALLLTATFTQLRRATGATTNPQLRALCLGFTYLLVGLLATSLFLSFAYVRYYWLLLALATAAAHLGRQDADTDSCREEP